MIVIVRLSGSTASPRHAKNRKSPSPANRKWTRGSLKVALNLSRKTKLPCCNPTRTGKICALPIPERRAIGLFLPQGRRQSQSKRVGQVAKKPSPSQRLNSEPLLGRELINKTRRRQNGLEIEAILLFGCPQGGRSGQARLRWQARQYRHISVACRPPQKPNWTLSKKASNLECAIKMS